MKKIVETTICFVLFLSLTSSLSFAKNNSFFQIHLVHPENEKIADRDPSEIDGYTKYIRKKNDYPKVVWVNDTIELDISDLKSVTYEPNTPNFPKIDKKYKMIPSQKINYSFKKEGAKKFAQITNRLSGQRIAIIINGTLFAVPAISSPITGGEASLITIIPEEKIKKIVEELNENLTK
ncbi:SecDF P1 head subdomain-containing protein [Desulfospira joergensenii]|uniref:SecDF P1 head subdomain-containing protein n=1 Tax=Desulfospira joergensenii TaxID=53329 RepID=UPI0012947CD2|nr:hypothetical protein [Desulfospira joergensenii]